MHYWPGFINFLINYLFPHSCLLYRWKRWKHYGLGHQVQQKRQPSSILILIHVGSPYAQRMSWRFHLVTTRGQGAHVHNPQFLLLTVPILRITVIVASIALCIYLMLSSELCHLLIELGLLVHGLGGKLSSKKLFNFKELD